MEIHKPKPWRCWPELLKEVGTIVIGVLIALAAEQGVEWLHWRHQIQEGRGAIVADHKRILGQLGARDAASPCISRRLDELEAILDHATANGRLPPLGDISDPPREIWSMRGWDALVSGQTLAHLSREDATRFSAQATRLNYLQAVLGNEIDEWSVLRTMRGPGRRLSDAEAANLRAALSSARTNAFRLRNAGDQLGGMIVDSGLLTKAEVAAAWRGGAEYEAKSRFSICHPISAIGAPPYDTSRLTAPPRAPEQSYDTALAPFVAR